MSKISKIDAAGHGKLVLDLAVTHTSRDIAAILFKDHGLRVPHTTVANYIKANRSERAEQAKALVNDRVLEDLPKDLDQLDEIARFFRSIYQSEGIRVVDRIAAADKARAVIDTKLKYSGASSEGVTVNVDTGEWREQLRKRASQ
jgi:hypothetical protein